ncbi:MAG TPA: hypothetical protein VGP43_11060 [Chitinophagaceae bacterium]|nr:hypothetical protein [Chitinophagaceae bacterium]
MHLLYITFGEDISNHIQAQFSIITFLSQKKENTTINIVTDHAEFYKNLKERINVIVIDAETLNSWKGEYDFFWRVKIKAIEMLCDMYANQPVLYLDTDTFLFGDVSLLKQQALAGKAFMHENEGMLSKEKSKTAKKMWGQVMNINYGNVIITANHCMWNAGVVLTPNQKNNKETQLALEICDAMCKQGVTRRLIEQFALSISLQEVYGLQAANSEIGHYWSNKDSWIKVIEDFFITANFKGFSIEEIVQEIKKFDFNKIPVKMRVRSTNTRLTALVNKLYPAQDVEYINNIKR